MSSTPLGEYSQALLDAVDAAIEGWVVRSVTAVLEAWHGDVALEVRDAAARAAQAARGDVHERLAALLSTDIDRQWSNPLSILRGATRFATAVLHDAGVPPVVRDEFRERSFPEDLYDLAPATWRDVDESLQEVGILWGAWKAKTHLERHRPRAE